MFGGSKFNDLSAKDFENFANKISELSRLDAEAADGREQVGQTGVASRTGMDPRPVDQLHSSPLELAGRTAQNCHEFVRPMHPEEYRKQEAQDGALRPLSRTAAPPPSYEDFLAAHYQNLLPKDTKEVVEETKAPLSGDEMLRLQALNELSRSQMPAVGEAGHLVKTIEHYTFSDGEDAANFYINFDKDLWDGASEWVCFNKVKVVSKATSVDIRLDAVPIGVSQPTAEWRLNLSPLFSRIEASMTTYKVKNGKLSIKVFKSKAGEWKKGLKY